MNKTLIVLSLVFVCLLSFTGCKTTKKALKANTHVQTKTNIEQKSNESEKVKEEKNLNTETKTVVTITDFYPPSKVIMKDTVLVGVAVKSITTTITTTKQTDKGKVETEKKEEVKTNLENKTEEKVKVEQTEKTKKPVQWGWIFAITLMVVGLLLYLKGFPFRLFFKSNKK